jgi:hypothetical protein
MPPTGADIMLGNLRETAAKVASGDYDTAHGLARIFAQDFQQLDRCLSEELTPSPLDWKRSIDPQDQRRGELDLHAAFQAGVTRGVYEGVKQGIETWDSDVPLDEDRWVATALELGPVAEQGLARDDGPQPGHEAPRGVHLAVSYHSGQTRYFPVGEDGWRFDTSTRELVIGRGVPRTHVPLDTVAHYDIEDC